jgi:peptidoglycan/xylan/chitin deacetylase (PgdA/CDA1 family)
MKRVVILAFISAGTLAVLSLLPLHGGSSFGAEIKSPTPAIPWSRLPPAGLDPAEVPQFVAVTFDDNFGLAERGAPPIVEFYSGKRNPGSGRENDFGGTPIATTFFDTSVYMVDESKKVHGGQPGEDHNGQNLAAWKSTLAAGHEIADHTVSHFNGGALRFSKEPCCRARDWSLAQWASDIAACRTTLTDPRYGLGATEVIGFRAPYLSYNDNLFTALQRLGFGCDSTVVNCLADEEDGTNCSWPYSLDHGSPDGDALAERLRTSAAPHPLSLPAIGAHPGLFEIPITTLIIPPDGVAGKYGFAPGLRSRVDARAHDLTIYDVSKAKIAGADYNLFVQAGMTGDEMRAVLQYNLDLHLSGNRSPLIFVAHADLYDFSSSADPETPRNAARQARWKALSDFITYALSKPEVRIVAERDILAWVRAVSSRQSSTSLRVCHDC